MDKIKRLKELTEQLNRYRDSYYNNSESLISDKQYDDLFDELQSLEEETGIVMSNSPTNTVGYEVKSKLEKVKHSHPMLSLNKTKSIDELKKFANNRDCLLMCKMDGLTVLLTYENGELIQAETRGNGEEGEIITHNAKVFDNIPVHIDYAGHLEVEGEAIITYDDFGKINSKLLENEKYKNPRNLVSGSVRQLDSNIAAQRHIKFIAWKVPYVIKEKYAIKTMVDRFSLIEELGFETVPQVIIKSWEEHYDEYINRLKEISKEKGFPIDGLVMTYNDISYGESLGMTGHHPKHSLAFKFYDEEYETKLKDIEWSMGKTGILTPIAIFEPVEIDNTIVERASLHNLSILTELELQIGDTITVRKSNQIIPQVVENLSAKGRDTYTEFTSNCPICGSPTKVTKENNSMFLICTNPNCKGKLLGKLEHFVSRNAINIDNLSEATLQKFIDLGWLTSFHDIYNLSEHKSEMYKLDGFGKKSVDKLLENIEKSRNTTLDRFIYSLSIPLIGRSASKDITKYCHNSIDKFTFIMENTSLEFSDIDGIGVSATTSLDNWWNENRDMFYELTEEFNFEVKNEVKKENNMETDLSGKTFVITGSLLHYKNRDELVSIIESMNGKVSGSVSAKTTYLINNDIESNSSKNKKAKEFGIPILSEEDFIKMIS